MEKLVHDDDSDISETFPDGNLNDYVDDMTNPPNYTYIPLDGGTPIPHVPNGEKISLKKKIQCYRLGIILLSWISMLVLGGLGLTTFVISFTDDSTASFAFALDAALVCVSSAVLLWRYGSCCPQTKDEPSKAAKKEYLACMFLGVMFYISAVSVISRAAVSLATRDHPSKNSIIWHLSLVNGIICAMFATVEFVLAKGLHSISIATDALNTAVGCVLAISTCVSDYIYKQHPMVWYLDPLIGVFCAAFLIIYGTWLIVYEVFHWRTKH